MATNLEKTSQHLYEDEYLNVVECDIDDIIPKMYGGIIQDAKTISAILAYKNKYIK